MSGIHYASDPTEPFAQPSTVLRGNYGTVPGDLATPTATQKQVTGAVNADGTVAGGTGFSVVAHGSGSYDVTFSPSFTAHPVVVASEQAGGTCTLTTVGVSGFHVATQGASDQPFSFIATTAV